MHCQERTFVRLPGYVDLEVYSTNSLNSLLDKPLKISATVCKFKPAEEHEVMSYQALQNSKDEEVFSNLQQTIDTLQAMQMGAPSEDTELDQLKEFMSSIEATEA